MKLGILFSGGKDSALAAYLAGVAGHELVCIGSMKTLSKDSYMFHYPNFNLIKLAAKSMNLPLITHSTKGKKEEELEDLKDLLIKMKEEKKIEGITTGAVASNYQYERITKLLDELRMVGVNPLWQIDPKKELDILLENNFEVMIVGVAAHGLDETHLGKIINSEFIKTLQELKEKYQISMIGEGGEFESLVLNCPLFSKKIKVLETEIETQGTRHFLNVKKAELV